MKKKSFFYKFDKDKNISKSSNHTFFAEDEEKTFDKLTSLLEKKEFLNWLIDWTLWRIEEYYDKRISKKKEIINHKSYLKNYLDYFSKVNSYILALKFDKILSYNDIEKITNTLWVDTIRVSWYDTTVEIISNNKEELLKLLKELIDSEIFIIHDIITNNTDYKENNRFIMSLEDIIIDTINRNNLINIHEGNNVIVSFSKQYISSKRIEIEILKTIYWKYKNSYSSVENITDEESQNISFLFKDVNKEFLEDIQLLDWLLNIEIIDIEENNLFQEIDFDIEAPFIEESLEWNNKICIAENKKIINNTFFIGDIEYWTTEVNEEWKHWTSVWLLAMYWKLQLWEKYLPAPECSIYNITYKNVFLNINKILDEAESNWCKIINISMWAIWFLKDNEPISTIAKQIDKLLVNRDLMLILSWWNIKPPKNNYHEIKNEETNINIPKDSISSIAIWAKNSNWKTELYSRKNNVDSEYNIWETKGYIFRFKDKKKPDLIDFWENIVFDGAKWGIWYWTSYAAPLIANKATKILNIYNNISTNTIKALFYNYASVENFDSSLYSNKQTFERHIWRWDVDITSLIEWGNTLNIVIEDFIWSNQKKEYPIKLPKINQKNVAIWIKRSISYNPPIDENYHLKYCKFCVSSQMWSNSYETKKQDFFDSYDEDIASKKWGEWKKEKIENKYSRPLNWVNYFWNNNLWVSNSFRENILNNTLYEELRDDTNIIIEWHTRNNFSYQQKFSFVMTIDIKELVDKDSYIDEFYKLNNDILIHGVDIDNINKNIQVKEEIFNELTNNDIEIDVESF